MEKKFSFHLATHSSLSFCRTCMKLGYFPAHTWLCIDCERGSHVWESNLTCFRCNSYSPHPIKRKMSVNNYCYVFSCEGFERIFDKPPLRSSDRMWGHIPQKYRMKPHDVFVNESTIPNAGFGLFCNRDVLPVGSAMPYEGDFKNVEQLTNQCQNDYALSWPEYGPYGIVGNLIATPMSYGAPQANEPCYLKQSELKDDRDPSNIHRANCVYFSSIYGLYLVVCRELRRNDELIVHYGKTYSSSYKRPLLHRWTNVDDESRLFAESLLNLQSREPLPQPNFVVTSIGFGPINIK